MTRKHFELIAAVIRDARSDHPLFWPAWDHISLAYARELANHNAAFKRLRFLEVCGYKDA